MGRLGTSLANGQDVWGQIYLRSIASSGLVVISGVIGGVAGVTLGSVAALRKDGWFDRITSIGALTVTALPEFIVAIGLIILFATGVRSLPAVSPCRQGPTSGASRKLLILPVATLVIVDRPLHLPHDDGER